MPLEAQLWASPECDEQLEQLLHAPGAPAKSWISRTFGVLDDLVDRFRQGDAEADVLTNFRPQPLVRVEVSPPLLAWPDSADGREFARTCARFELCLFQIGRLRSAVAVIGTSEEAFVVWLSAELTASPRDDGFVDDEDAALAEQTLLGKLNAALDLTWVEKE
jgi:hypothetical protein